MTGSNPVSHSLPNCRVRSEAEFLSRLQRLTGVSIEPERDHVRLSPILARVRPRVLQPSSSTGLAFQLGALLRSVLLREDATRFPDACLGARMPARASDE